MIINRKNLIEFFANLYNPVYTKVMIDSVERFIGNEKSKKNQLILLDIVALMQWIKETDIYKFTSSTVLKLIGEFDYIINFKRDSTSSSTGIINMLMKDSYIFPDDVIDIYESNEDIFSKCNNSTVLLVDDFSGTGSTFKNCLKKIIKSNKIKLKIVCYAWTKQALENMRKYCDREENILDFYIYRDENLLVKRYDEIYSKNTIQYIEYIVSRYLKSHLKFGYMNSGTVVSVGGVSPNNNIPLIWDTSFTFEDERRWIPLLNRSVKQEVISRYKEVVFKSKKNYIFDVYKKHSLPSINFRDFQTLYVLFLFEHKNDKVIREVCGFETDNELNNKLSELIAKGYLNTEDDCYIISNEEVKNALRNLDSIILLALLDTLRSGHKKISSKFITENFSLDKFR